MRISASTIWNRLLSSARLRHLQVFVTVAELQTVERAAGTVGISQVSAMQAVADLERLLECKLFLRRAQGMVLTPAGSQLLPLACRMLGIIDDAATQAAALTQGANEVVRVAAIPAAIENHLGKAIPDFTQSHPGVLLHLQEADALCQSLVADGDLDCAFYLGFPTGISGAELAEKARQQAVRFGVEILQLREGVHAVFKDGVILVDLADGTQMSARSNICATGIEWRRLGIANEDRYLGAGLFYGAGSSEAPMCTNETVYVVGGGNSAGQAAMNLSHFADEVIMLVRGERLADTLSDYLVKKIEASPRVRVVLLCEVVAADGPRFLRSITVRDRVTGKEADLPASHVFVCIGGEPNTDWARDTSIVRDKAGYLVTGPDLLVSRQKYQNWPLDRPPFHLETSVPGSFAAGDVRHGSIKRVASAVGEGAMVVAFVHQHLAES